MSAHDIPGYVQGFVFNSDSANFDLSGKRFIDQAGYGPKNYLTLTEGSPVFSSPGGAHSEQGLLLDNSVQGKFLPATPWQGALVTVIQSDISTNGKYIYPMLWSTANTITANGNLALLRATSSDFRIYLRTYGASAVLFPPVASDQSQVWVAAFELNQGTAKGSVTLDGVAITETAAQNVSINGNRLAIGFSSGPQGGEEDQFVRFGNTSGVLGDTAPISDTATIFESHFYKGTPLQDNPTEVAAFLAELRAKYGVN